MPHLPAELLLPIFNHIRDELDHPPFPHFPHLGLLSCSLVCRFWYFCAFPFLLEEDNKSYLNHNLDQYTTIDLERLADLMAESQRYGLDHCTLIEWVQIKVPNLFVGVFKRLDQRRMNAIGRLIRALQPRKGMVVELVLREATRWRRRGRVHGCTVRLKALRYFASKFQSNLVNVATLHLCKLDRPYRSDPPISHRHPIVLLIHHLHIHLENILLESSDITLALLQALRACQNIHTARINRSKFYASPADLATTVGVWLRLRHLSICYQCPPYVGVDATVAQLARCPPPNLEHLNLDNLACITLSSTNLYSHHLPTLLQHCAHSLVHLDLPANHFDRDVGTSLLTLLARLHFPRLETLNITRIKSVAIDLPDFPGIHIRWPSLRCFLMKAWHIDVHGVAGFVRSVVFSCPKLELVRMVATWSPEMVLREAGFVKMANWGEWIGEGDPWVRKVRRAVQGSDGVDK